MGRSTGFGRTERYRLLLEVPLRERSSRAGLQITFEADRPLLIRELNDHVLKPRPVTGGVGTTAHVVVFRSSPYIGCEADIETGVLIRVSQDVDEVLCCGHEPDRSKPAAGPRHTKRVGVSY